MKISKYVSMAGTTEHTILAEIALGKKLPIGACVHHVDGNSRNNTSSNLVICPSNSYHQLLHTRQKALDACGNANYKKCRYCKKYDDPLQMKKVQGREEQYHYPCARLYHEQYKQRKLALVQNQQS